ncbi:hypothetical protein VM1G_04227 [Cytospora mali]|uniref:HNH nuclease domain-containing protein n=1 Tax=Cytospora mali TaxID=578113 RepID=A0A194VWT3_CYTMA|nr:hypothetical protein VM1G_04227 [Valsa mali]
MPRIVTVRDASQLSSRVSSFREDVWRLSKRGCAVTREGDVDGTPCPGFEAAHIVPQSQWMVFPMDDNQNIADPTDQSSLNRAWLDTWTPERNGIMLDSTLHKCFDQRLWSIHPEKRKLRVFIDIPYLHKFHGQTVYLSKYTEDKVLQHHYDMCVLENMVIPEVPNPLKLTNTPSLAPRPMKYLKTFDTDPSKQSSNLGTPSFPGVPSFPGGSSSGTPSSGGNAFFPPSRQAAAHPPSPPLSKPGSEERILWPYNEDTNKVPSTAQQSIEDISDDDGQRRGRSRKKRRCTSSEVGDNWVAKWQRLE